MKRILIVDDYQHIRDLYQELFMEAGYEVGVAEDGEAGLNKILEGGWDLILLDVMMPKLDGLEVLKRLQEQKPKQANGKILMLSVLDQEEHINSAMKLGASGYLLKSNLTPEQIVKEVEKLLVTVN